MDSNYTGLNNNLNKNDPPTADVPARLVTHLFGNQAGARRPMMMSRNASLRPEVEHPARRQESRKWSAGYAAEWFIDPSNIVSSLAPASDKDEFSNHYHLLQPMMRSLRPT